MKKRSNLIVGLLLAAALLVAGVLIYSSNSSETGKSYVVGIVNPNQGAEEISHGFIEGLAEQGREGQNISYIVCNERDRIDSAIKDMVARQVDLIYAVTTPAVKIAQRATEKNNIPVIFHMHDPLKSGILQSLTRPAGNLTGVQVQGSTPKALEWLLHVSPDIKKILVPIKFDTPAARQDLISLQAAGKLLNIEFLVSEVNSVAELDKTLSAISADIDALFILHSIFLSKNLDKITGVAIARKLPTGSNSAHHDQGIIVNCGFGRFQAGKQASRMAHMILEGKAVADIPVETANFPLIINLKTASASEVYISDDILLQADDIIR